MQDNGRVYVVYQDLACTRHADKDAKQLSLQKIIYMVYVINVLWYT